MDETDPNGRRERSTDALERSFEDAVRRDSGVRHLWTQPRLELRAAAQEGELLFAHLRIVVVAAFAVFPVFELLDGRMGLEAWLGALVILGCLALSGILLRLASAEEVPAWVSFASTWVDISILTTTLAVYAGLSDPLIATNSQFTWGIYLLTIAASALRYDPRVCLWAGGWSVFEYLALVLFFRWRLEQGSVEYGSFSWYTQAARVLLMLVATFVAWVLVRRAEELWRLSVRDARTGLYNHTFFVDRLEDVLGRAERVDRPVSLAMIDIDHFKDVNDRYGHAAGDRVLEGLARALRYGVGRHDLVGRYGGDEFAILMPGLPSERASRRIADLLASLPGLTFATAEGPSPLPSISVGLATSPEDGRTAADLLQSADRRLYAVKEQGRGTVLGVG
ncbi:MAG: GGDEF domain-containing protein [Thermoanaerobaculia bacterium]